MLSSHEKLILIGCEKYAYSYSSFTVSHHTNANGIITTYWQKGETPAIPDLEENPDDHKNYKSARLATTQQI